jgi:hypothetical protein
LKTGLREGSPPQQLAQQLLGRWVAPRPEGVEGRAVLVKAGLLLVAED